MGVLIGILLSTIALGGIGVLLLIEELRTKVSLLYLRVGELELKTKLINLTDTGINIGSVPTFDATKDSSLIDTIANEKAMRDKTKKKRYYKKRNQKQA